MKNKIGIIGKELFEVSLMAYLILLVLESVKKGFVSNFFNLNVLLLLVLISGILMVLFEPITLKERFDRLVAHERKFVKRFRRVDGIK